MEIKKSKYYTRDNINIVIYIRDIHEVYEDHIIASVFVFNKSSKKLAEESRNYQIFYKVISDWKECDNADFQ